MATARVAFFELKFLELLKRFGIIFEEVVLYRDMESYFNLQKAQMVFENKNMGH